MGISLVLFWWSLVSKKRGNIGNTSMVVNLDHPPHVWLWMHEDKGQLSGHLATNRTQEQLHLKIRLETHVKNLLVQTMMKY